MWLDLRNGAKVRITEGHNIQGAKQELYMHIGASQPVTYNGVTHESGVGLGHVVGREEASVSFNLQIEGVPMRLGIWWLESAMRGAVDVLPVVNQNPTLEDAAQEEIGEFALASRAFSKPSVGGPPRKTCQSSAPLCSATK